MVFCRASPTPPGRTAQLHTRRRMAGQPISLFRTADWRISPMTPTAIPRASRRPADPFMRSRSIKTIRSPRIPRPSSAGRTARQIAAYDADRQPLRVDRPDGQSRALEYDSAGRPTLVDMTVGDIRYSFDAAGRLTSAKSGAWPHPHLHLRRRLSHRHNMDRHCFRQRHPRLR